ncbi:PIN domain-containing protein [Candidatus Woesearchaeota archaeon]|nr:PIN domain-containing protein [Candidatus Woesearchaeota archaeon]
MIEDSSLFLIDTNILVYASEELNDTKNKKAKELVDKCWLGKTNLAVSSQNLAEFIFVVTKKGKLDFEKARIFASYIIFFEGFKKINHTPQTIIAAAEISTEFKIPFWDALLAATMRENGIFNIYTENAKDFKMPWIKAVNPFT